MESQASPLYAAIDLGSNSFHLLVVRKHPTGIQTITQMKHKVRLADGLDDHNRLSDAAMQRGLDCLQLFAIELTHMPLTSLRVVATATLRIASNAETFLAKASDILAAPIQVLGGEQEAELIYQGACQSSTGPEKKLVIDIGGASTEIITGCGHTPTSLHSLPMGCVTWLNRFFTNKELSDENFDRATHAAHTLLLEVVDQIKPFGWQICMGASGTLQTLYAISQAQAQTIPTTITLATLCKLRSQMIECGKLERIEILGLKLDRAAVFPSGLAILIAIFQALAIENIELAGGALREGLIYTMLLDSSSEHC